MDYVTILGLAAAALSAVALSPQVVKVWRTKSTKDISLGMFAIFCIGVFLWLFYGILKQDTPIIVANILIFIQAFIIVAFKVKYK